MRMSGWAYKARLEAWLLAIVLSWQHCGAAMAQAPSGATTGAVPIVCSIPIYERRVPTTASFDSVALKLGDGLRAYRSAHDSTLWLVEQDWFHPSYVESRLLRYDEVDRMMSTGAFADTTMFEKAVLRYCIRASGAKEARTAGVKKQPRRPPSELVRLVRRMGGRVH